MKKIFLVMLVIFSFRIEAQIGINTSNPQSIFHIDGKNDNPQTGVPPLPQQINDVVITSDGRLGIGTILPQGAIDINSIDSGFIPPRMSTLQRDSIQIENRPKGSLIFNVDTSFLQLNTGSETAPIWRNLNVSSSTLGKTILYGKGDLQTIDTTWSEISFNFDTPLFSNIPEGYITKINNTTLGLAPGKVYKIEVDMGRFEFSDNNEAMCQLFNDSVDIGTASILPMNYSLKNWNNSRIIFTYINNSEFNQLKEIKVKCSKINAGTANLSTAVPATLAITIMN